MNKESKFTIPNIITSVRIVGAVCLLFTKSMSFNFFILFTLCGISDAMDGLVARATQRTSEFGAKLDSIADLMFYSVLAVKIFPYLLRDLPVALWYVGGGVVLARIITYLFVAIKHHRFAAVHTYLNKATGFVIFSIPYFIAFAGTVVICSILGVVASLATIEELLLHILSKEYPPKGKSIFQLRRNMSTSASA